MVTPSSQTRYPFERYLNTRSAYAPTFSPDGSSIAFLTDITGMPEVWQIPVEGGWPDQLTFASERVMSVQYANTLNTLVFGMDSGGNEREQLFLLRDGQISDVAVDSQVMHTFGTFSPDDCLVAYSDNRRIPAFFDVYVSELDGSNERLVYEQDGSNYAVDWSPDGQSLLLFRRTGARDSELFLLDIASGDVTHLTPHTEVTLYGQAAFAPDSRSIYLVTNENSEFSRAARMDLATRELTFLTPDDADIDWLSLSPDGRLLAMVRNVEGYGCLVNRDIESSQEREASMMPDGVAMKPEWSPDSERLAFAFTHPAGNLNIWIWHLREDRIAQITRAAMGGIPPSTFVSPEHVRYPSFDGRLIPAFLYMPRHIDRPAVIVNVHGGPESQAQPSFGAVTQYFVNRGYAVLIPNVRGSTGYGRVYTHLDDVEKRMDSVADLSAAADWLKESERVDGDRIAVMGGSYGGFMVLASLTTYPDTWAAGVDIVGIANFETFLRNTGAYRRHWRIPEYGDPDRDAELFRRISPIHYVDRIRAPLMVIHGDNDPRVPLSEAEQIVTALERRASSVEFLHFSDEGHGIVKLENKLIAYPAIAAFLDRYLG